MSGRGRRVTGAATVLRSPVPMTKVSVIVPVYNPGSDIDDLLDSLLGQTMPAGELELIFVDDGSTDATPARLDELAAAHRHVRVQHIPNSGWPGKPRNLGIDMAQGEYVFFADNDDWLEADAIERLYATAVQDRADIVIGKVVGHGKQRAAADLRVQPARDRLRLRPAARPAHPGEAVPPPPARRGRPALPGGPPPARGPRVRGRRPTSRPSGSPCWRTGPSTTGCAARSRTTPPTGASTRRATSATSREVLDLVESKHDARARSATSC